MKKVLSLIFFLNLMLVGGTLDFFLKFDPSQVIHRKVKNYDLVELKGYPSIKTPGKPGLPRVVKTFVIPSDAVPVKVEIVGMETEEIPGEFYVYPAHPDVPLPMPGRKFELKEYEPDKKVYNSNNPFPSYTVRLLGSGLKNGYRLVQVEIFPLKYIPAKKRLIMATDVKIRIVYEDGKNRGYVPCEKIREEAGNYIRNIVENPEDVERFAPRLKKTGSALLNPGNYEYVIITESPLDTVFQKLADWERKKGIPSKVVKVSWITSNYSGYDTPEKIRNFIIDAYNTWGTRYILLGGQGDDLNAGENIVPCRKAYYIAVDNAPTDSIPSDLYYGDLDGTWDLDGDHVYGEYEDSVFLYTDVYVGRAPVLTPEQAQRFIDKVLTYEKNPPTDYLKKMMLPTAVLWSDYDNLPPQDSIARMTPAGWFDAKMYEQDGNLSEEAMIESLNVGYGMGHWEGHGNQYGIYMSGNPFLSSEDADTLHNQDKLGIAISIACWTGAWDSVPNGDCFAEHLINSPDGGLVAVMMNSRYGWGAYVNGQYVPGPSEKLDTTFFSGIFDHGVYRVGDALAYAKDLWAPYAWPESIEVDSSLDYLRWCIYELNLLGDPEMPLWTDTPGNLDVAHNPVHPVGGAAFSVTVADSSSGTPVESAYVCISSPNDTSIYATGWTDASGSVDLLSLIHI